MSDMQAVADLSERLNLAIRRTVQDAGQSDPHVISNALAAAISMVVSYDSMQAFLETLAACADEKEEVWQLALSSAH
jgi:hypothetical protein